jgi:hypothetical protein
MDRGEGLQYALASILRMSKYQPVMYSFDIICQPQQDIEAVQLKAIIKDTILESNPQLGREQFIIMCSNDPAFRPAAELLVFRHPEIAGNFHLKDPNPNRDKSWKK